MRMETALGPPIRLQTKTAPQSCGTVLLEEAERAPGPTAITSSCWGISLAVSGDDATRRLLFRIDALDQDAAMQRTEAYEI